MKLKALQVINLQLFIYYKPITRYFSLNGQQNKKYGDK